jgi:hypothetical protein
MTEMEEAPPDKYIVIEIPYQDIYSKVWYLKRFCRLRLIISRAQSYDWINRKCFSHRFSAYNTGLARVAPTREGFSGLPGSLILICGSPWMNNLGDGEGCRFGNRGERSHDLSTRKF